MDSVSSQLYFTGSDFVLYHGDCAEVMRTLPENSVDTICTDPPYALTNGGNKGFMGKEWDAVIPSKVYWAEALRVAKPGAMLLAFGGDRTHHRLMCAIEDSGWEIRTCIYWIFGSGFPKSLDISKAIDKAKGAKREVVGDGIYASRRVNHFGGRTTGKFKNDSGLVTAPATDLAKTWQGWGTALKPAAEIIIMAMKPLQSTYAANAEKWGVAGLNIDGSRIGSEIVGWGGAAAGGNTWTDENCGLSKSGDARPVAGRWPANVMFDEDSARLLDEQSGVLTSGARTGHRNQPKTKNAFCKFQLQDESPTSLASSGGASRFFYTAKASRKERGEGNSHPTVKPLKLMEYLCNLTKTPTGGVVLDPFCGSGTTGMAARLCGRRFIGIDLSTEYLDIAIKRCQ